MLACSFSLDNSNIFWYFDVLWMVVPESLIVIVTFLKEHLAMDRSSWSLKSVWSVLKCKWLDNLKVELNYSHRHASILHGFPYTSWRNMVGHFVESKFWLHKMADCVGFLRPTRAIQGKVFGIMISSSLPFHNVKVIDSLHSTLNNSNIIPKCV